MDQQPEKNDFNLDKILLPKKEVQTPTPASRVNAGVLLETEQAAELPKGDAAPIVPPQKPVGPIDDAKIAPLQTFQGDMENVITQKNLSTVSMAASEATRREKAPLISQIKTEPSILSKTALIAGGVVLLCAAAGVLAYVLLRPTPSVNAPTVAASPYINVDDTQVLVIKPDQFNRTVLMQNINSLKESADLSLGLIRRLYVTVSSSTVKNDTPPVLSAQTLLTTLAPNIPQELARTFDPNYYMLGVHVFDGTQALLIFKVDSYEQAFSGMLSWERTIAPELSPLFSRTPRPRTQSELSSASSTPATISFIQSGFRDRVVENHDTRVIENESGDILLLWTFLTRDTLVITTNEWTLKEIISRLQAFTPGQ